MDPGHRQRLFLNPPSSSNTTTTTSAAAATTTVVNSPKQLILRQPKASDPLRELPHRRHRLDQPAIATATVLAPSVHYQTYTPAFSQHSSAPTANSSVMISSEPCRHSDDNDAPNRQSLPSISEVISGARPSQFPPPNRPSSALPPSFPQPAHQYADSDKHPSPQPMHPVSSFPQRQDTLPAFVDSPRLPFNGRHRLPPVSDRRPTPPVKPNMPQQHPPKPSDNAVYSSHPYQPTQLPPGQVPLPNYPISPRHQVPVFDARAQPPHPDEADYANRARLHASLNRPFESWNYQESLSRIGSSSRIIFNFAEAYTRIAREQHGSQPIPERLPTEREVSDMLANLEVIKRSFEQVKDVVQASIQSERAREGIKVKGAYDEDHDVPMYGDAMKPQYAMPPHEVKKRRGRAAPPGRCHSCNRIDTPEWRRGPDGARTLCNACGLHYAKLERKRQSEARSIRPKPDERS